MNSHLKAVLRKTLMGLLLILFWPALYAQNDGLHLAYIVSDLRIPFWQIMSRGMQSGAAELNAELAIYSADNDAKTELENTLRAIKAGVDGLIISPTTSSSCTTILKLAERAGVPAVIADIGTDGGNYLSYISSDNQDGAYRIGKVLAKRLHQLQWDQGRVGIIAIPQKRLNGQARTAGFMRAMREAGIEGATIRQQVDFSYDETYRYSQELINLFSDLRAIWLQGSDRYQAALDAIRDSGREGEILLITFDAEPEFLQLIPAGVLVGAAMQQPFLMGKRAVDVMHQHFAGEAVANNIQLPILAVSSDNIDSLLSLIKQNVLGQTP